MRVLLFCHAWTKSDWMLHSVEHFVIYICERFRLSASLQVQPGQGNTADLSDMRSLSGGERSFSTVCFVLSLWAITEAPFRCLDEFDVYMVRRSNQQFQLHKY